MRSSSTFRIAVPSRGRERGSESFSRSIASMLPSFSRWVAPMLSTAPTDGSAMAHSSAISPSLSIAISSTETSWSRRRLIRARGSPSREFRFPGLWCVAKRAPRAAAVSSFAVVFPTVPVMPATRTSQTCSQSRASSAIAVRVSPTTATVRSGQSPCGSRSHTAAGAPPLQRFAHEVVAVEPLAPEGGEQVARLRQARVGRAAGDRRGGALDHAVAVGAH